MEFHGTRAAAVLAACGLGSMAAGCMAPGEGHGGPPPREGPPPEQVVRFFERVEHAEVNLKELSGAVHRIAERLERMEGALAGKVHATALHPTSKGKPDREMGPMDRMEMLEAEMNKVRRHLQELEHKKAGIAEEIERKGGDSREAEEKADRMREEHERMERERKEQGEKEKR